MIPEGSEVYRGSDLLRLLEPIRRARGFRLYTHSGRRVLDLWQDGGRAILGHSGAWLTSLKNAIDRGPTSALPSVYEDRLTSATLKILQVDHPVRVFANRDRARCQVSRWLGKDLSQTDIRDPALAVAGPAVGSEPAGSLPPDAHGSARSPDSARLWRPFLPAAHSPFDRLENRCAIFPVFPAVGDSPPQVVVFPVAHGDESLPESDIIAPYRLAALIRGIHDLPGATAPNEVEIPGYQSVGPYLTPVAGSRSFRERFSLLLQAGFLTSPLAEVPSIIPGEISPGELAQFRRAAAIAVQSESGDGN